MKNLVKVTIALMVVVMFVSCENPTYDVTVIANNGADIWTGETKVTVVTKSGDTIKAFIEESILLNNTIPFPAKMQKNGEARFGFITKQ